MTNNKYAVITGTYIDLVLMTVEDAEDIFRWRNSQKGLWLQKGAENTEAQRDWIAARPTNEYNYIIKTKEGVSIGLIALVKIDMENKTAETGRLIIGEDEYTKQLPAAYEALYLINELAFTGLGLNRIYGIIAEENSKMIAFQKYMGLVQEGRLRQHIFVNGKFRDAFYFGLLADEYYSGYRKKIKRMIDLFSA
ncbi:MAG: GNAT family N-acetyltransferase [Ignavibacteriales bacterium]|nr:GNAT family N-acetyltransferase [Ignavibacteriales bacterium]